MAGEVIGRSGVFEEDDTTFCFLVILDLEMSLFRTWCTVSCSQR
jgi:hypothetical protein